jgi:hypothetical protein
MFVLPTPIRLYVLKNENKGGSLNIYQISYMSTAAKVFGERELQMLLRKSRVSNSMSNITGALVYNFGQFLQFLEGPEDIVNKLYDKINHDPRHNEIQ